MKTPEPPQTPLLARLRALSPEGMHEIEEVRGLVAIRIEAERLKRFMGGLRDDEILGPSVLSDLTALDRLTTLPRFEVVYHLRWPDWRRRLRVKVALEDGRPLDSVAGIWPDADWLEREVFDFFGIRFTGHPHLRRLLLPEGFGGHPLRRDFAPSGSDPGPNDDPGGSAP
jgi:NADH-quinone oxidoreductase subunit C